MTLHRRAVRVRLRKDRALTGQIHISDGPSLTAFLSGKLFFLNLTDVLWEGSTEDHRLPHLSVRLDEILWVEPLEGTLHLTSAALPSEEARDVELHVDGDLKLHVQLNVTRETRMSDYLDANPGFLPLWSVRIVGGGERLDRVALNHRAIEVIRELEETDPRQRF
jgi:hypothetical protein